MPFFLYSAYACVMVVVLSSDKSVRWFFFYWQCFFGNVHHGAVPLAESWARVACVIAMHEGADDVIREDENEDGSAAAVVGRMRDADRGKE